MQLTLYVVSRPCIPCKTLTELIEENDWEGLVDIVVDESHPLVYDYPSLIVNSASVYRGVEAIRYALCTALPRKVEDEDET